MRVKWSWVAIAFLCWAVVATSFAGYYYIESQNRGASLREYEKVTMKVNLLIDYGNGTSVWYNDTLVPLGSNLLNATKQVVQVDSTYWPDYDATLVDGVGGVANSATHFWFWDSWDSRKSEWAHGQVGADKYLLDPGEIVKWYYASWE